MRTHRRLYQLSEYPAWHSSPLPPPKAPLLKPLAIGLCTLSPSGISSQCLFHSARHFSLLPPPKAPLLKSLAIGLCTLSPSGNILPMPISLRKALLTPHYSLLPTTYYLLPTTSPPPTWSFSLLLSKCLCYKIPIF